jgi:flavodoxin
MNVLVLYQSRNGHTREAADGIADAARRLNHNATIQAVSQVRAADIEAADVVFVGTWVQGYILFGVKPAGATLWVPALPSLNGKPVGLFCTYLFNPRGSLKTLGAMLEARGATVRGQHAFHRARPHQGAEAFVQSVLQASGRAMN